MAKPALDMIGIAARIGVSRWRVRRWRDNAVKGVPNSIRLPSPDVCNEPPRWSPDVIDAWVHDEGIRPATQAPCSVCGRRIDTYAIKGTIRPHGWTVALSSADELEPCPGSFEMPAKTLATVAN